MSDAGPDHAGDGGQRQPQDRTNATGLTPFVGHGRARPVREFRMSGADRVGNAIFSMLTRAGIGPAYLLTTRGRKTGQPRTNPVILVQQDGQRWLVAPYGTVSWVLNARAAGRVTLRRGRASRDYTIRELAPAQSGHVLHRYIRIAPAARPYFQAGKNSPIEDFIAEADRHPVFELTPIGEDAAP
jgi:deazaflavin-dependent oxidoreductase (nitroreductase family)